MGVGVNSSGGELVLSVSDLVSTLAKNLLTEEWTRHHIGEPIPTTGHISFIFLWTVCSMTWQQWLFNSPMAPLRLLKFRGGHQMPPHLIQYYGMDGKQLLTTSQDCSLWRLSVICDSRSFEMFQCTIFLETIIIGIDLEHGLYAQEVNLHQLNSSPPSQHPSQGHSDSLP